MTTTKLLKLTFSLIVIALFTACSNEELDSLNYTADDMEEIILNQTTRVASYQVSKPRHGKCFSLVFPISVAFPDGSEEGFNEKAELRTALKAWKEANPDSEERPNLLYPLDIEYKDGTIATVESVEQLKELKAECKGKKDRKRCFSLVYPVTIEFPDGETQEVDSGREFKGAIRTWKKENRDAEEKPSLIYPVDVELEDGTTQTVNSLEEMEALKEDC